MPFITEAWEEGKLPIVVGGTGLYVKAITQGIETMQVPIDDSLRTMLSSLSIPELQSELKESDPSKFASMNCSDSLNPRRLTRAIEISMFRTSHPERASASRMGHHQSTIIGLKYSDESIQRNKIMERVVSRLSHGAIEETKKLLDKYDQGLQSMTAIGYKSIISFLEGNLTEAKMIEEWVSGELAYAKRQMTWFRKQPVIWYDVDTKIGE
jgi:tRNA dimethylallyltransferase